MGKQVKLTAVERIQYAPDQFAEPGDTFETTEESAAQLLELGHATKGTAASTGGTAKSGPLPDDFPGRDKLADAGIRTYAQLRDAGDVTEIPGIGEATAKKIADALKD
ncbi:MAG TPA: helix-hairpin-helix domain-containing protein [Candidatus Limnocylindria bacterium]|jgi:hypothetical protein|nr:helix-hairpin-helix domain-containing protein [Candidatus Limnocylindria bacterium]